jgi:hypothetical protein
VSVGSSDRDNCVRYEAQATIAAAEADGRFWHFVTRRRMTE